MTNPAAGDGPLLRVEGLRVVLRLRGGDAEAVRDVSLSVDAGETLAVVGESGCGKSLTMSAVMGLEPRVASVVAGRVIVDGFDLLAASDAERRSHRGRTLAMIYQDPMTSLNPTMRIGRQIAEACVAHGSSWDEGERRAIEVLGAVGIPRPERAARSYPHEFSGGMRQRAVIAMALAMRPRVLIADEPTTALDVTIQQQIIDLVGSLQQETGMGVIWVTHDLGVVARIADRVAVMYAGRVVEEQTTARLFADPQHPYTAGLLAAIPPLLGSERPPLQQIDGALPSLMDRSPGCAFRPRCPQAVETCALEVPPLVERGASRVACIVPPDRWTPTSDPRSSR